MKICYIVVLVVLFSQTMTFKMKKSKTIITPAKQKCEKIKCPPVEDPVCVKIKNKYMKEVYVIAINKCEIKYANCHKDINATIVPMENCDHDKESQNIKSKRNKRDVDEYNSEDLPNDRLEILKGQPEDNEKEDHELLKGQSDDNENKDHELLKGQSDDNENKDEELLKGQSDDNENKDEELLKGQSDDNENKDEELLKGQSEDNENKDEELLKGQSDDNENKDEELLKGQSEENENKDEELLKGQSDDNENKDEELLKGQSEDNENKDEELLKGQSEDNEGENADSVNNSDLDANEAEHSDKLEKKTLNVQENAQSDTDENDIQKLKLVENIGEDYDQGDVVEADLDENNKTCPTVCPSRDVMVCAKCQHNIHRSFLSLCHLRMFACKHTSEKLKLVQREPCVQSAPFLTEFKETKGRIPESGELDEVQKFIFCRDKKLLNKDDPRCRFVEEDN